jgi:putative endonuclease
MSGGRARDRRRRAYGFGLQAESLAALWLRLKGWRVLDRRFRTAAGEIDLVVRRGSVIAFVEVKARPDRAAAMASLNEHQRRRVVQAAQIWQSRRAARLPPDSGLSFRLDVVLVVPRRLPRHLPGAWEIAPDETRRRGW